MSHADQQLPTEVRFNCGHSVHRTEIDCPRCQSKEAARAVRETLEWCGDQVRGNFNKHDVRRAISRRLMELDNIPASGPAGADGEGKDA